MVPQAFAMSSLPQNFGPSLNATIDIDKETEFKWNGPGESVYPFVQYLLCFEGAKPDYYCLDAGVNNSKVMKRADWDLVDAEMVSTKDSKVSLKWYVQSRFSNGKQDGEKLLSSEAWDISYLRKPGSSSTPVASGKLAIAESVAKVNAIVLKVKNQKLTEGNQYLAECVNPNSLPKAFEDLRYTTVSQPASLGVNDYVELVVGPLEPATKHKCYVAVKSAGKTAGTYTYAMHSDPVYLTTEAAKVDGSGATSFKLPPAGFEDKVLYKTDLFENPFSDTNLSKLSGVAAAELYRRSVIGGFADGEFKGGMNVNRAEAAKFLLLAKGLTVGEMKNDNRFRDVIEGQWYTKFVMKAASLGVINGYDDGTFRPANTVNTAEFLKMLSLTFGLEKGIKHDYTDVSASEWYDAYAGIAQKYNLFPERGTKLMPAKQLTRDEVAVAIYQYLVGRFSVVK